MGDRFDLDERLVTVLGLTEPDGDRHVYFNPSSSVFLKYPAIKYSIKKIDSIFASGGSYRRAPAYDVILIDENPDSEYVNKILELPYCAFDRFYIADNLNHWSFTIYNL